MSYPYGTTETAAVLENTDWKLLREQKQALVNVTYNLDVPDLEGLVSWIDAIQDAAVKEGFATNEEVFGGVK